MNEQVLRDVVDAWDAYVADRTNETAAFLFVLAMNELRESLAATPAPSVADAAGASDIRTLIADDAYAMSFQTMGQYRSALLNAIKKETGK